VHFSGFNAAFQSDLPEGLELGTEASFDLATVLAVRQMFPYSVTELGADLPPRRDDRGRLPPLSVQEKMILARWCRSGSTQLGDGGGNGSDPLPALLGRAWQLLGIDCRFETVDHYPMIGVAVVVSHSGVRPGAEAGLSAKANRKACEAAAAALRARSLRSVEMSYLKANRERLTPRQYECAFHVVGELQRVVFAERALREEDHPQFGHYLSLSHQSARETLRNTCAEVDLLVELSLGLPGCLGSRMVGEGFGGAVASLVAYHQVEAFIESLAAGFRERTGISLEPKVLQVVDGTG
jgi:galactokinase